MDLTKLFVLVPSTSAATVAAIKTASAGDGKVYFMAKYNQIVAKGVAYGIDPVTAKEIETTITAMGGAVAEDGTVTVDFSATNYAATAATVVAAIKALDTKIKGEMDKLAASKTLNDNYEVTARVVYHAGTAEKGAYIAFENEENTVLGSEIAISDIIGSGILDHSSYDKATGKLHLFFKTSVPGVFNEVIIDLGELFDIDDVAVAADSTNYLKVNITTKVLSYQSKAEPHTEITPEDYAALPEDQKALYEAKDVEKGFEIGTKMVTMAEASTSKTGLADAYDVKQYVDNKSTSLTVEAEGDDYVSAYVAAGNNKKVWVSADVQNVAYSAGVRGNWSVTDAGVASLSGETNPSIAGVEKALIDSKQGVEAIQTYVDAKVAQEAAERAAKIEAAVKGLDSEVESNSTNVNVKITETDGKLTGLTVSEDYAEITKTASTSTAAAPKTDAAITVKTGDEGKLVKASDIATVAAYAADKVMEEQHRVDKKIADLAGDVTSAEVAGVKTQVTTAAGNVAAVVTYVADNTVAAGGEKDARTLTVASVTNVLKGQAIGQIKTYVDNVVADATTDLEVRAAGDTFVSAYVDAADNKKVWVSANAGSLTVTAGSGSTDTAISGDSNKFIAGSEIASKVASYVNARISEEINKLDQTSYDLSNGNVHLSYSQTDGLVNVSGLSLDYATVGRTAKSGNYGAEGYVAPALAVTDGAKLAIGSDIEAVKLYADDKIAEEIQKLDKAEATVSETGEGAINFKYSEADGIVSIGSLGVTYSEYTASTTGSGAITTGIVSGTELKNVLADLWETYQEPQA